MLRHSLPLLAGTALVSLLSACTTGTTTTTSGNPSPKGSSTSATEPAKDGGSSGGEGDGAGDGAGEGDGSLGPQCTAYIACCEEVAATTPAAAASCDSVKTQIENAEKNGVSAAQYEASCKSGIATFKSAGYCK